MGMCVPPGPVTPFAAGKDGVGRLLVWHSGLYRGAAYLPVLGYSPRILRRIQPRRVAFSSASMRESASSALRRSSSSARA